MDPLADAMNALKVAEHKGHRQARVRPASKTIREVLKILQSEGYIKEFEFVDDSRSGEFRVTLDGKINNCGTVKPRFAVKKGDWDKYEQRYLPSRELGILVVSTSKGILSHGQAKSQGVGGRLLAYAY